MEQFIEWSENKREVQRIRFAKEEKRMSQIEEILAPLKKSLANLDEARKEIQNNFVLVLDQMEQMIKKEEIDVSGDPNPLTEAQRGFMDLLEEFHSDSSVKSWIFPCGHETITLLRVLLFDKNTFSTDTWPLTHLVNPGELLTFLSQSMDMEERELCMKVTSPQEGYKGRETRFIPKDDQLPEFDDDEKLFDGLPSCDPFDWVKYFSDIVPADQDIHWSYKYSTATAVLRRQAVFVTRKSK